MHGRATVQRSPGPALWGLWILLSIAAVGFALLLGGLVGDDAFIQQAGLATLATGAICFLFLQFWIGATSAALFPPRTPQLYLRRPGLSPRFPTTVTEPLGFDYPGSGPADPASPLPGGLVLFEPVSLVEGRVQPTAEEKATRVLTQSTNGTGAVLLGEPSLPPVPRESSAGSSAGAPPDYHEAVVQKRDEFLQRLPLVEQILKAPAAASKVKGRRTLGQCSGCGTKLWAPTLRPIRLRCPRCGRVALLD